MNKDVPVPQGGRDPVQRIFFALEIDAIHVRRADQFPVQPIGPAVIRAQNAPSEVTFRGVAHARAAMAADVVKRADGSRGIAQDHDVLARYLAHEVIAGIGDHVGSTGAYPGLAEEALPLLTDTLGIGVIT